MRYTNQLRKDNLCKQITSTMKHITEELKWAQKLTNLLEHVGSYKPYAAGQIKVSKNNCMIERWLICDMCYCDFNWGDEETHYSCDGEYICTSCFKDIKNET